MSKTFEHYQGAAYHHERAAHQFQEAAKYHQTEEIEKEAHHAYLARGHAQQAHAHEVAAAKLYVASCDPPSPPRASPSVRETVAV
jgi:hypothetical protein